MQTENTQDLTVPQIGEGLYTVRVLSFYKQVGDELAEDEAIYCIETDKTTIDIESPVRGTLLEWFVEEDDVIEIGTRIARIGTASMSVEAQPVAENAEAAEAYDYSDIEYAEQYKKTSGTRKDTVANHAIEAQTVARNQYISPRTRAYCRDNNISIGEMCNIPVSGAYLKPEDVDRYMQERNSADGLVAEINIKRLSVRQQWLAEQFRRSQQHVIPASIVTSIDLADFKNANRKLLERRAADSSIYVTEFQFFAYWVSQCLKRHPRFMSVMLNDREYREFEHINLGIAVHSDSGELITAVIDDADTLDFDNFVMRFQAQVELAMQGKDQASDRMPVVLSYMGSSNVIFGSPLLVSPSVATIFFSNRDHNESSGQAYLSLTFDHRILNGMDVTAFFSDLSNTMSDFSRGVGGQVPSSYAQHNARIGNGDLRSALLNELARLLNIQAGDIDEDESLGIQGLDSLKAVGLKNFLENRVAQTLPSTLLWHYPSVAALLAYCESLPGMDKAQRTAVSMGQDVVDDTELDELLRILKELPEEIGLSILDEIKTNVAEVS